MIRKVVKFIIIVLLMAFIFSLSADTGSQSTKKSDSIIVKSCEVILGRKLSEYEKEKYINKFVKIVRKSAHLFLYFLLGLAIISFIKEFTIISYRSIALTILIVFVYAISDEVHQMFVNGRSGEILDVVIDTIGGVVASFSYWTLNNWRRRFDE